LLKMMVDGSMLKLTSGLACSTSGSFPVTLHRYSTLDRHLPRRE
jgi:hypothetical protein